MQPSLSGVYPSILENLPFLVDYKFFFYFTLIDSWCSLGLLHVGDIIKQVDGEEVRSNPDEILVKLVSVFKANN